ncbi:MAG: DUF4399 domain-containing protein [Rudaea sp.]|nr:DUF4399 domain-containing protein [Rudaea sp.]
MRHAVFIVLGFALTCGAALAQTATTSGPGRAKAPAGARVFFVSPKNGATVGQDVLVKFGAKGIVVAPATDATPNTGHHHLLIDQTELPPGDAPIPNDATHKHYGKGQTEDTIHLEPGDHTLQLDFADARHMQFDPPLVSRKITIHVK